MSGNKIVIIVLILIAVLFFIGIGVGVKNDEKAPAHKDEDDIESLYKNKDKYFPDWAGLFDSLFSPLRPKLKLDNKVFTVPANSRSSPVRIPPDDKIRIATFFLVKPGTMAVIQYNAPGEEAKDLKLPRKKKDDNDNPYLGSFAVYKGGGTIHINCIGNTLCKIELQ